MATKAPSLDVLGNDIIYQICSALDKPSLESSFRPLHQYERTVNKNDLAALASTSRSLREFVKPILFSEIIIRSDWGASGHWSHMAVKVEKLLKDNDTGGILQFVRRFEFSLRLARDVLIPAPTELPYQLASVLSLLPKVQTLNILIPEHEANVFSEVLEDVKLPLVEKIFVGAYNEFFISLCPNVRTVWTDRRFGEAFGKRRGVDANPHAILLIDAVLKAGSVRELKISQEWTVGMVNALVNSPNRISLLSEVSLSRNSSTRLPELLGPLSSLSSLRTLELGSVSSLNVDFNPPLMRIVSRQVDCEKELAQEKVVRMVEEALGGGPLTRLVLGDEEFRTSAIFEKRGDVEVDGGVVGEESGRKVGNWVAIKTKWDMNEEKKRILVEEQRNKRREHRRASRVVEDDQQKEAKQARQKAREDERRRQAIHAENRRMFELEEENRQRIVERKKSHN